MVVQEESAKYRLEKMIFFIIDRLIKYNKKLPYLLNFLVFNVEKKKKKKKKLIENLYMIKSKGSIIHTREVPFSVSISTSQTISSADDTDSSLSTSS